MAWMARALVDMQMTLVDVPSWSSSMVFPPNTPSDEPVKFLSISCSTSDVCRAVSLVVSCRVRST
jgi:hypothetical protein